MAPEACTGRRLTITPPHSVSEKMLIEQLRQIERDGIVRRFVHQQVPPRVDYSLTDWGQALCPSLDALLTWVDLKETMAEGGI